MCVPPRINWSRRTFCWLSACPAWPCPGDKERERGARPWARVRLSASLLLPWPGAAQSSSTSRETRPLARARAAAAATTKMTATMRWPACGPPSRRSAASAARWNAHCARCGRRKRSLQLRLRSSRSTRRASGASATARIGPRPSSSGTRGSRTRYTRRSGFRTSGSCSARCGPAPRACERRAK